MTRGRMKRRHVIYLSLAVVLLLICGVAFAGSLTPYVTFNEAKAKNTMVQVRGALTGQVETLEEGQGISFALTDEDGTVAQVVYKGIKPNNMEHADGVVVEGNFDGDTFNAGRLLVKCPSKYESKGEGVAQ